MSELKAGDKADTGPQKKEKMSLIRRLGRVRFSILIVLVAAFLVSGYLFIDSYLQQRAGDSLYTNLESGYLDTAGQTATPPLSTPTPIPSPPVPSGDPVVIIDEPPSETDDPEESSNPANKPIQNYAPDVWPDVDWEGLRAINSDTAAWLLGVGTNINYPVVHGSDNEKYLKTMFDGNTSKVGTLFIDARNRSGFADRNTVIYGHNMRNHSMFWTLTQYKSQAYYNSHPTLRLITPEGKYEIQLFAGIVANATETSTFWKLRFEDDEEYIDWILEMFSYSTFKSYVELTAEDKVVTLSTCSYEYNNARYIVIGKLVPVS